MAKKKIAPIQTRQDDPEGTPPAQDSPRAAAFWLKQLETAAKREEAWHKQGEEAECRYLDERKASASEKRVNVLWANVEVMKGALFAQLGNPDVRRLFPMPGREQKIARTAALVMERALVACNNRYDVEDQIEEGIEDNLLPGRGVLWLEYEAKTQGEGDEARVTYQDARLCSVDWRDFRHGSAKKWRDVPWVGRLRLFTKEDVEAKWPAHAGKVKCDFVVDESHLSKERKTGDDFKRAKVWEIWHKAKGIRVHVAEGYDFELDRTPDPYRLEKFFPCSKPLYAVKTTSSLTPKPEYLQYKDQLDELDRVNTRMWHLLEKLKYCGVYDGSSEDGDALAGIGDLADGKFIPYKNFAKLMDGGGLAAAFQVRDLAPIAATVQALAQRAVQIIEAIYEITGLSDILRGVSDPDETLGAQQLKAKSGGSRLDQRKKKVQNWVRDNFRMKAELIAEHFTRDQLQMMTGVPLPTEEERDQAKAQLEAYAQQQAAAQQAQQAAAQAQQQGAPPAPQMAPPPPPMDPDDLTDLQEKAKAATWEEVSKILRSDDRRNYKIDIETDATSLAETEEEKAQRLEFVKVMIELIGTAVQGAMAMGNPGMLTLAKEFIMFAAKGFKVSRSIEEQLDDAFAQIAAQPPQSQAPEDPLIAQRKADLEAKIAGQKAKNDMELEKARMQLEADREQHQMDLELAREKHKTAMLAEHTAQLKLETDTMAAELGVADPHLKRAELDMRREDADFQRTSAVHERDLKERDFGLKERDAGRQDRDTDAKHVDMEERRRMDGEDMQMRRDVEGEVLKKRAGARGDAIEGQAFEARRGQMQEEVTGAVAQRIDDLAMQFTDAMQDLSANQLQIAQVLSDIRDEQREVAGAVTEVARYLTAPRKVKRGPDGRSAEVEIGANDGDLPALLAKLKSGKRSLSRGADGRMEGIS